MDRAAMEAAWELGAWDLRARAPGPMRPARMHEGSSAAGVRRVSVGSTVSGVARGAEPTIRHCGTSRLLMWVFDPQGGIGGLMMMRRGPEGSEQGHARMPITPLCHGNARRRSFASRRRPCNLDS